MNRNTIIILFFAPLLVFVMPLFAGESDGGKRLWVYAPVNFQVDKDTDRLIALLKRSAKAGYNGAVVTDYKFGKLDGRPRHYYRNLERTRQAAEQLKIELIPAVMPIGYSNSILQNNPNLAAGLPVKDCLFVVSGTEAKVPQDNLLPGGAFETAARRMPSGWDWIDGFGASTRLDRQHKHSGQSSLLMHDFRKGNSHGNCRVVKRVSLKPFHQYRFTMWVKTDALGGSEFKFMPLTAAGPLNYANIGVKPTQDWKRHRVVFNSLNNKDAKIYIGVWSGRTGSIWIDDVRLEEVGGVNLLRRDGCPIHVRSSDGSVEYQEGRDYKRWADPKLGNIPWLGDYDDDHDAPPIRLTTNSRIRDGDRLRVSFYHTVMVYDGQVCCSLVADELFTHLRRQIELIKRYLKPKRYFMSHDEIRVAGYDELAKGRPAGKLLAENVGRCVKLIHDVHPGAQVLVWSDMFDPHHNAHDNYYLVRGTLAESWLGLAPSVGIMNWNGGKSKQSLAFFAERGHQQIIAGYYDGDVAGNIRKWRAATEGVKGVNGFMYTTWRNNYDALEEFARRLRESSR